MDLEQVYVSAVAFGAVFIMLSVLAGLMALLTRVFPGRPAEKKKSARGSAIGGPDQELIAAVSAVVASVVPGGHVTRIEEIK